MSEINDLEEFVKRKQKETDAIRAIMDMFAQSPNEDSKEDKESILEINKLLDEREQMNSLVKNFVNIVKGDKEDK